MFEYTVELELKVTVTVTAESHNAAEREAINGTLDYLHTNPTQTVVDDYKVLLCTREQEES